MFKVEYSPQALEDLQTIKSYIVTNWGESVAAKIMMKIVSDIRRLENYPASGVELGKFIEVPTDYRYLFSDKNYIFYRIEEDKIRIVRVLNEHQDYMNQLFGLNPESDTERYEGV